MVHLNSTEDQVCLTFYIEFFHYGLITWQLLNRIRIQNVSFA